MARVKTHQNAGRPKAIIDWSDVAHMIEAGVSAESVAVILGIERTTLYRRCEDDNKISFSTFCQQNRAKGDRNLYAKQVEVALEGNPAMLIWLGKNRLGQTDKQEVTTDPELARLKSMIEACARESGTTYEQELRIYLDQFADKFGIQPDIKAKLTSELVQ